jgi:hypothetical protein
MPTPTIVNLVGVKYVEEQLNNKNYSIAATIKENKDDFFLLANSAEKNIIVKVISVLKPFDAVSLTDEVIHFIKSKALLYKRTPYIATVVLHPDSTKVEEINWLLLD